MASRHLARSIALQSLFEWDFYGRPAKIVEEISKRNFKEFGPGLENEDFVKQLVSGIVEHIEEIDKIISQSAPEWPIEQITPLDRNVLRLGLFELLYAPKEEVPPKVAINEAIELAKSFGGESSGRFVNGVLGTVYNEMIKLGKFKEEDNQNRKEELLGGGVVFRRQGSDCQIALVLDAFGYWTFPKGHKKDEEAITATALREAGEELGLKELKIVKELGEREYIAEEPKKGEIKRKTTDFLIEAMGDTELNPEKSSGIKDAKWFALNEIGILKQYKKTKEIIDKVIKGLKDEGLLKA